MLDAKISYSLKPDAYFAGKEIGEYFADMQPEVLHLFLALDYIPRYSVFLEGIRDGMGGLPTHLIGATGDGFFSTELTTQNGAVAMGLHSHGHIRWHVEHVEGISRHPEKAAWSLVQQATPPAPFATILVACDYPFNTPFLLAFSNAYRGPIFGGFASDHSDAVVNRSIFHNEFLSDDAALILSGSGPIELVIDAAGGWTPFGRIAEVTEMRGRQTVVRIGNQTAGEYFEQQIADLPEDTDALLCPLAVFDNQEERSICRYRAIARVHEDGAADFFGGLKPGQYVSMCLGTPDDALAAIAHTTKKRLRPHAVPAAALAYSCRGRKWFLGDRWLEEQRMLKSALPDVPFLGLHTFGEITSFCKPESDECITMLQNFVSVLGLLYVTPDEKPD